MLEKVEAEIRGDDVMNALAGEKAKLPTANVAATARRRRDVMVAGGVGWLVAQLCRLAGNRLVVSASFSAASRSPSLSGNLPVFCHDTA